MDDIIRNIWLRGAENVASVWLVYCIILLSAIGSIVYSRLYEFKDRDALLAAILVALTFIAGIVLTAIIPSSPLLGVTGTLFPSPWSHGLFPVICLLLMSVSVTYGLVSGTVRTLSDVICIICYGISRWSWVVVAVMTISFIFSVVPS